MAHVHSGTAAGRRLGLSIFLTLAFVLGEAASGYFANSLALLSDAGHNFADALALIFSWYAVRIGKRPADAQQTISTAPFGPLPIPTDTSMDNRGGEFEHRRGFQSN